MRSREFEDPRGWRCKVVENPARSGRGHLSVSAPNGSVHKADVRLIPGWDDPSQADGIDLWEALDAGSPAEKLALLVDTDHGTKIGKYIEHRSKYTRILDAPGPRGWTPLFRAVAKGSASAAKALVAWDACPYSEAWLRLFPPTLHTPLSLALELGNFAIIAALLQSERLRDIDILEIATVLRPHRKGVAAPTKELWEALQALDDRLRMRNLAEPPQRRRGRVR